MQNACAISESPSKRRSKFPHSSNSSRPDAASTKTDEMIESRTEHEKYCMYNNSCNRRETTIERHTHAAGYETPLHTHTPRGETATEN